jgi:hypothetical protein
MSRMRAASAALLLALVACASEVYRRDAALSEAPAAAPTRIEIAKEAYLQLPAGYSRALPQGSVWNLRGGLPEGAVYRRADGIFTVEGAHVHEAYLVIAANQLVGFYLPVEKAYAPFSPVTLNIK